MFITIPAWVPFIVYHAPRVYACIINIEFDGLLGRKYGLIIDFINRELVDNFITFKVTDYDLSANINKKLNSDIEPQQYWS